MVHLISKTKIRNSYGNIHFWRWGKLGQGALTFPTHKIMSIFVKFLVWLCYDSDMLFYVIFWNTSHIKDLFRAFNWFKLSYNNMRKDHAHSISWPVNGRDMKFSPKHVPYAHLLGSWRNQSSNAFICKITDGFIITQYSIVIHKGKRVILVLKSLSLMAMFPWELYNNSFTVVFIILFLCCVQSFVKNIDKLIEGHGFFHRWPF